VGFSTDLTLRVTDVFGFGKRRETTTAHTEAHREVSQYLAKADAFLKQNAGSRASIFNVLNKENDDTMAVILAITHDVSPEAFAALVSCRNKAYTLEQVVEKFIEALKAA
jgi:hypothetical protein